MSILDQMVADLYKGQNISFIGSVDSDGFPQVRAMLRPRKCESAKTIYFSTNTSTHKAHHFRTNPKACVYFCDPVSFHGALLVGTMEILETKQMKELLWHDGDELYYPGGVDDPDYCVLRFTAVKGRCYGNFQSQEYPIA